MPTSIVRTGTAFFRNGWHPLRSQQTALCRDGRRGVFDLINSWVSVGGEGDLFVSDGYGAGRAGPIGQFNFIRHRALRPFVIGGVAWGENDGPMVGSGMELWARDRIGFRVSAQD